jgi:hypothetical protein
MIDMTKLMALVTAKQKENQKLSVIRPKAGQNRYVLLPGWDENNREIFWHDFGDHWIKDFHNVNSSGKPAIVANVICEEKTRKAECPICNLVREGLSRCKTDEEAAFLRSNYASKQGYLLNVLALDSETPTEPQVLHVGRTVFEQILALVGSWGGAIFDASNPQIVTITRSGAGLSTSYIVQVSPEKYALKKGIIEKIHNLDDFCAPSDPNVVKNAIHFFTSAGLALGAAEAAPAIAAPKIAEVAAAPAPAPEPEVIVEQPLAEAVDETIDMATVSASSQGEAEDLLKSLGL